MHKEYLTQEMEVVWLEDIDDLQYVRSRTVSTQAKKGELPAAKRNRYHRLVGYSNLADDADTYGGGPVYMRRMFYLKTRDEGTDEERLPPEAVVPETVEAGEPGVHPTDV